MVEVSEKFRALAQSAGRHVFCRIEAGNEVFLDDRILEFDFDDVVHPDWFTLGTTCANRFAFSVRYDGELNVRDTVRPFISFDGEEWCPLGVFFVARRYVRGKNASIICYDEMYSLDMEYSSELSFPSDTVTVLKDICDSCGISCEDFGEEYTVAEIPEGCTVRDMIGYIAGMNRACAKLDRSGALVFKKHGVSSFVLSERNCWSVQRNMGRSAITCLKADTGGETLMSGDGADISTIEMYNPLMTQARLDALYALLRPFSFYGADVEMQGMPFLEAGESIEIQEGAMLYPLVISEIEYHYDGGLSAVLYSKNKSYPDSAVYTDDLKKALEELRGMLGASCLSVHNDEQLAISEEPVTAAEFVLETAGETFAQVDVNFTVDNFTADFIVIKAYVNGTQAQHSGVQYFGGAEGARQLLHFYFLAQGLPAGSNTISVTIQTVSGSAYILPNMLLATAVWHGGKQGASPRDRVNFSESLGTIAIGDVSFTTAALADSISCE
ncbi:MAG: hypothetical protein ACI4Q4_09605 [Oscillospiraceae bacterium]